MDDATLKVANGPDRPPLDCITSAHRDEKMTEDDNVGPKIAGQASLENVTDLVIMFSTFPLFATVASLLGSGFVAIITGGGGMRSHLNWNNIWRSLVNGGVAGALIGISCGLLSTIIYRLYHSGDPLQVSVDHAMDAVQPPLFWLALVAGAIVAFVTISIFRGAVIWEWRIPWGLR